MKTRYGIGVTVLLVLVLLLQVPAMALKTPDADIPIDIRVNGDYIQTDAPAFLDGGSTYVPIRFVAQALQAEQISFDPAAQSVTIVQGGVEIRLFIGLNDDYLNGRKVSLSGAPRIYRDRTFVPVRFVSEGLGADVKWDARYYTVDISKSGVRVPQSLVDTTHYSQEQLLWLARIIEAESAGEPLAGQVAVGNVILNRVNSSEYPNTIYDVVFDRMYGVQFEPILNGTIYNDPSADCMISVNRALRGDNFAGNSFFFLNPRLAGNTWILQNRTYYTTIGNHDFYL